MLLLLLRMLLFRSQKGYDRKQLASVCSQATRNDVRPSFIDKHIDHNHEHVHRRNAPRNVTARNAPRNETARNAPRNVTARNVTANVWKGLLTYLNTLIQEEE